MRRRDGNKKRRVERQEQAVERQATYDAMSLGARLARAESRSGAGMTRELAWLYARLPHGESIGAVRLA